jgi:hypothetical protein
MVFAYIQAGFTQATHETGIITGHVLYKDGSPVNKAEVQIHFFGSYKTINQLSTQTDEKGYFSLTPPLYGDGVITASKISEGYPDAALALFGRALFRGTYTSLREINLQQGAVFDPIDLKFGEPDAWIEWTVQSDFTQDPIKNARYTISWSDNPGIMASSSIGPTGQFIFVLPKHPVTIKISAPGFEDWSYRDEKTGSQALMMTPGTHEQRIVSLRKLQ